MVLSKALDSGIRCIVPRTVRIGGTPWGTGAARNAVQQNAGLAGAKRRHLSDVSVLQF